MKCVGLSRLAYVLATLILTTVFASMGIVIADNANFTIQPQKEHVITLSLQETDSASGSFSVISDDDTGIDFFVIDAQNKTVLRYNNVKQKSFSFTAEATGIYQLHFDNSVSSSYSKTIALNYNTIHYIMGMPQEQFLFVAIAAVAIIGIMAYALLMPK